MTKLEKKYEELVVYLKALTISHSPDEEYENRLLAEIAVLKEQQESKEQETAEEILDRVHNIERMSTCMEDSYVLKRTTIRAMREYAQQESKITDEMIEKWATEYIKKHLKEHYQLIFQGLCDAAKAYRDGLI